MEILGFVLLALIVLIALVKLVWFYVKRSYINGLDQQLERLDELRTRVLKCKEDIEKL